jgi:ATP-dependent DNA helicase RecQ
MGHLAPDSEAFGALKLTETSRGVLKGETAVMLREETSRRERTSRRRSKSGDASAGAARKGTVANPDLLAALKAWRSETARKRSVPAYVVLHDSTIEGIAASRPATPSALRGIPGIGDVKLEHYGDALIALVTAAKE